MHVNNHHMIRGKKLKLYSEHEDIKFKHNESRQKNIL